MSMELTWQTLANDATQRPGSPTTTTLTQWEVWWETAVLTGLVGGLTGAWTCVQSCDGSSTSASDLWTGTFTPAALNFATAGNPHSWRVDVSPANFGGIVGLGPFYRIVDLNFAAATSNQWTVVYSKTLPSGGTTSARPTAPDEFGPTSTAARNSGSLATSHWKHVSLSTGGIPWFFESRTSGTSGIYSVEGMSILLGAKSGDPFAVGALLAGGGLLATQLAPGTGGWATMTGTNVFFAGQKSDGSGALRLGAVFPGIQGVTSSQVFADMTTTDSEDGDYDGYPIGVYGWDGAAYRTLKGQRIPDVYWPPQALATGRPSPISGPPYEYVCVGGNGSGQVLFPWTASAAPNI